MAYESSDIGSLRFLAANVFYQATNGLLAADDEKDSDIWDDAVLLMDVVSSYLTETDPEFQPEWEAIQRDRANPRKAQWAPGENRAQDAGFRQRELKAMFRSLCRQNQFVRHASATAEWKVPGEVKA